MFSLALGFTWGHAIADLVALGLMANLFNLLYTWKIGQGQMLADLRAATDTQSVSTVESVEGIQASLRLVHHLQSVHAELTKLNTEALIVMAEELRRIRLGDTDDRMFPWEVDPSYNAHSPRAGEESGDYPSSPPAPPSTQL